MAFHTTFCIFYYFKKIYYFNNECPCSIFWIQCLTFPPRIFNHFIRNVGLSFAYYRIKFKSLTHTYTDAQNRSPGINFKNICWSVNMICGCSWWARSRQRGCSSSLGRCHPSQAVPGSFVAAVCIHVARIFRGGGADRICSEIFLGVFRSHKISKLSKFFITSPITSKH